MSLCLDPENTPKMSFSPKPFSVVIGCNMLFGKANLHGWCRLPWRRISTGWMRIGPSYAGQLMGQPAIITLLLLLVPSKPRKPGMTLLIWEIIFCITCSLWPSEIRAIRDLGWGYQQARSHTTLMKVFFKYIFWGIFWFFCSYNIQHCFVCRPSDSTVPTDAEIEPRTVATCALAVRRSNH